MAGHAAAAWLLGLCLFSNPWAGLHAGKTAATWKRESENAAAARDRCILKDGVSKCGVLRNSEELFGKGATKPAPLMHGRSGWLRRKAVGTEALRHKGESPVSTQPPPET